MVCGKCKFETKNEYNFCPNCGEKLDEMLCAEEVPEGEAEKDAETAESPEELREEASEAVSCELIESLSENAEQAESDEADGEETEPLETTPTDIIEPEASVKAEHSAVIEKKPFNRAFVAAMSLFTVITLAASGILYFNVLNKSAEVYNGGGVVLIQKKESNERPKVENIYIPEKELTLYEGSSRRINFEVYPPDAELNGIEWSCSGDGVSVSQTGRVTALVPGYNGTVTVSCGDVKAETSVRVLTRDEAFYEAIDWIARKEYYQSIDFAEKKTEPAPLKQELTRLSESEQRRKWGANLFARINDELPSYDMTQKQLINKETGNKADCDIYSDDGDIRKIVTVEYFTDYVKVTDYYYISGKLGFVFEREESYYRPSPANWGIEGTRLYFEGDAMTTWRDVSKADERLQRDASFVKTDYSYGRQGIEWNRTEYTFDNETNTVKNIKEVKAEPTDEEKARIMNEYAAIEARMLNSAYNLYDKLSETPDTVIISGCVVTADALPMKGVAVKMFSERYDMLVSQTVTGEDGTYSITAPNTEYPYTVHISQEGYIPADIYNIDTGSGVSVNYLPEVRMISDAADTEGVSEVLLSITDAFTGEPSDFYERGGILKLREGINNKGDGGNGNVITVNLPAYDENAEEAEGTEPLTVEGITMAEWLPDKEAYRISVPYGNYTAELLSSNRETSYFILSAAGSETHARAVVVQKLNGDDAAIVLTWGASPQDLDARLYLPSGEHVSGSIREIGEATHLTSCDSGYGPETIRLKNALNGMYKYYAADITNLQNGVYTSKQMSNSFARVSVYTKDGLVSQFYVPRNVSGNLWHVFNISNGKVTPVQRYYNNIRDLE